MNKLIFAICLFYFSIFAVAQDIKNGINVTETYDMMIGFYYEYILEDSVELAETLIYINSRLKANDGLADIELELNAEYTKNKQDKIFLISHIVAMPLTYSKFNDLDKDEKERLIKAYVEIEKLNSENENKKPKRKTWKM